MNRLTQHSKTTMFTDSDVIVEGKRLGPAAFGEMRYYRHYVKIINRLAELEDRFCNEPQTHADRIRSMTDEQLAAYLGNASLCVTIQGEDGGEWCSQYNSCNECIRDWLRQEVHNEP